MICNHQNHGDHKTRLIQRVRVRRDRRHDVVYACDRRIRSRRRGVLELGRNGLEIAPARGERAGHLIYQPNTRRTGDVEIVNRRGSQADIYANRMATVISGGRLCLGQLNLGTWCVALPCRENARKSSARRRRYTSAILPLSVVPRGGAKIGVLQFRPRHGAEGINAKRKGQVRL